MASEIERLNRYTLFVDDCSDNDQRPRHHNSLKQTQPYPTKETTKKNRLSSDETSQPNKAPPRLLAKNLFGNILVPVVPGSPWDKYEKKWPRELAGKVAIAVKLPAGEKEFIVRSLSGEDIEKRILTIRQFHHENLIRTYEIFACQDAFYLISEPMCISLIHVCRCPRYPEEQQLVAIVKQSSMVFAS
ncbi:hypothetical protein P152DRAFT_510559 [Eremomyces bilateralis CBS 781.70]|uniref:Protein kinase domain-containing protein n=1 Tax=Eremomyces bilateralis CBS 781.70 TaxID=1392243 RepID=A0A6G1GHF6_9PEZI|nr:uncharacterized protein P152DRAFT_510559 [Eremomyces bilateralis CBS 781.70]KAF1817300.1 hypothetical protein P152DRAFT_510559 [Eremomyces bilateralis CBS 781.70]